MLKWVTSGSSNDMEHRVSDGRYTLGVGTLEARAMPVLRVAGRWKAWRIRGEWSRASHGAVIHFALQSEGYSSDSSK